jgi:hypothetical protein
MNESVNIIIVWDSVTLQLDMSAAAVSRRAEKFESAP